VGRDGMVGDLGSIAERSMYRKYSYYTLHGFYKFLFYFE